MSLLSLFLGSVMMLQIDASITKKIEAISRQHPELAIIAVCYNPRRQKQSTMPTRVGHVRILEIPVKTRRDLLDFRTEDLLTYTIQGILVLDDGGRVTTPKLAIKHLMKIAESANIKVFTDATDLKIEVHGKLITEKGTVTLNSN